MSTSSNVLQAMPHRERTAWLALAAIVLTFGPYFVLMGISPPTAPLPDLGTMGLFAIVVVSQAVIQVVGRLWLRLSAPEEATAPADERDRAISLRSVAIAYYVLIAGMILVGCVMPFNIGGWKLINGAVAVIVLAELIHYGVAVWSYRRGWHG